MSEQPKKQVKKNIPPIVNMDTKHSIKDGIDQDSYNKTIKENIKKTDPNINKQNKINTIKQNINSSKKIIDGNDISPEFIKEKEEVINKNKKIENAVIKEELRETTQEVDNSDDYDNYDEENDIVIDNEETQTESENEEEYDNDINKDSEEEYAEEEYSDNDEQEEEDGVDYEDQIPTNNDVQIDKPTVSGNKVDVKEDPYLHEGKIDNEDEESPQQTNQPGEKFPEGFKVLNSTELDEYSRYATTHYKIIEGKLDIPEELIDITQKIQTVTEKDIPNFEMKLVNSERLINDGNRAVQVVCVQSGYKVNVVAMKNRELRSFGRIISNQDTYNYRISLYQSLFGNLRNFSIGKISFEDFINITTYPDAQTLMFGLYRATFPGVNSYRVSCDFCGQNFNAELPNGALIFVPPGTVTNKVIQDIIYKDADPKTIMSEAYRYKKRRIFLGHRTKFIDIKIPSIHEFLQKAYFGKKENIIEDFQIDMYYSGYIAQVGILDVETLQNKREVSYLTSSRIEVIDKFLAELTADDKAAFDKEIDKFLNECTISYRIPRLKCPHCSQVISQKEINMENLFFFVRNRKGLY